MPKVLLTDQREIKLVGALGLSSDEMKRFVNDLTRLTSGRAQGVTSFRS